MVCALVFLLLKELYNLSDYIHDYLQQYKLFIFSSPSFDRPAIDFPPIRDEFLFVPPQITSESFIYTPIEKPAYSHTLRMYNTAWQDSLTKEECEEVLFSWYSYVGLCLSGSKRRVYILRFVRKQQ